MNVLCERPLHSCVTSLQLLTTYSCVVVVFRRILVVLLLLFSDIPECEKGLDNCSETCTNTIGSFTCGCHGKGYILAEDGTTCVGKYRN